MEKWNGRRAILRVNGPKLAEARIAAGYAMSDLIKAFAEDGDKTLNRSSISRWENGVLNPSPERIQRMVNLFGTADFIIPGNVNEVTNRKSEG